MLPPTAKPLGTHGGAVLPIKTFSYLAAGRAILGPKLPDISEVLVDGRNACLVPPDDPTNAAVLLRELLSDENHLKRLSKEACRTASELTWDARAERIKSWLLERCWPA